MGIKKKEPARLCDYPFLLVIPTVLLFDTHQYQGQELKNWQNLTSASGKYRLQFFSTSSSSKCYLGIHDTRSYFVDLLSQGTILWLANRNNPIPDPSSVLFIDKNGTLKIAYTGGAIVLSFVTTMQNVSATLLDSGNLVLQELNSDGSLGKILWQSFDHPTSFLMPGMKIGIDFKSGQTQVLTSWVSPELPADGSFTLGVDPNITDQLVIWYRGSVYWTSGPCNNGRFKYAPMLGDAQSSQMYMDCGFVSNKNGKYFSFSERKGNLLYYIEMNKNGYISLGNGKIIPDNACYKPGRGGCKETFKLPKCRNNLRELKNFNHQRGFVLQKGIKFEENYNMSLFDCQDKCLRDCSCMAFASVDKNGTGCQIWEDGLSFDPSTSALARDIYYPGKKIKVNKWRTWVIVAGGITLALMVCFLCYFRWKKVRKERKTRKIFSELGVNFATDIYRGKEEGQDFQVFSFESIAAATKNFSIDNKLGQGGFGPVYKGHLPNGQLVAVKRLSRSSGQGLVEFKNEISLIAKLQHKNLVRLLGCSIEVDEKLLIYEYMPNKSLDFFLFNCRQENILDWPSRYRIIEGIAQGILYLHKYSRLRIIHRDLKASNVLLDDEMNPKISDFGMARIFGHNESEANTIRVVGTYGYMSPEYAMEGTFSIKSDVFSFGVLLLEIVSGKRNNTIYHHSEQVLNLIAHTWKLSVQSESRGLELMDPVLSNSHQYDEVLRCIHVGLLCVQENPNDRPTMSDVISMLTKGTTSLSRPKKPAFFTGRSLKRDGNVEHDSANKSINNVTITILEPRSL